MGHGTWDLVVTAQLSRLRPWGLGCGLEDGAGAIGSSRFGVALESRLQVASTKNMALFPYPELDCLDLWKPLE